MTERPTDHELAAKLHSVIGKVSRSMRPSQRSSFAEVNTLIGEVIIALCTEPARMPVIPPVHPPVDPTLVDLAKGPF